MDVSAAPRGARRLAALQLWMANIALGTGLGSNYLTHVPSSESLKLWLFALPALVSSVLILTLAPGVAFYAGAHYVRSVRTWGWVQAIGWTFFQVLLFTDTRIFNMFRYHVNGQVINLVYTRGSEDAIHLGWQVWTAVSVGLGAVGCIQVWAWRRILRRAIVEVRRPRSRPSWLPRPALVWCLVLLPAVFVEKTIYAQAHLTRDRQLTALARLFPLYARVPMEDLASRVLGVPSERPPRVELEGVQLDYPLEQPTIDPEGPRPSFLVVVIDCLRRDMLDPECTPALWEWSRASRRFEDHVSAGNSTRYGLFGMLYGIHGSYWFPFLQEGRSPVLLDALVDLDYEIGVFSSASMNYPEMRETAWAGVPDSVHDEFASPFPWRRDELAAEAAIEWLTECGDNGRPFFGFVLLDAPHQTYSHPPGATPFTPSADELDYLAMTRNEGPTPQELERVRNRYRNAVHHADRVAGQVLDALAASGLDEDTVVIATGDHGEEFRECGFFGHTSAFTPEQVAVPFLVRGPGVEPGVERRPTSHVDFAATVLEMLGADPEMRGDWTLGENFLDPPAERRRVISGWNELGVWAPQGILRVPLSLFEFDVELYDYRWRYRFDDEAVLREEARTLVELGRECNRFLR